MRSAAEREIEAADALIKARPTTLAGAAATAEAASALRYREDLRERAVTDSVRIVTTS